ncbi:MAG: EAL domain-containing protein, partial [Rhodospirillaceae bacterium]
GDWVMEESFRTLARWRSQGLTNISMAVNLSAVQFRKAGLLDRVRELLSQYDLPASKIELELTESMLLQDGKGSIKLLEELSELGVRLSIDDFGTGYSSLAYLKQFSVDCLKVDQSFVRHLVHGSSDAVIARAIIGLGHSLGLAVVAEGVETEEQYNYLRDEGCDIAQGYLLAKPLPEAEAMAVLEASREPQDVTDESVIVSI